jgi:hypothetical protein
MGEESGWKVNREKAVRLRLHCQSDKNILPQRRKGAKVGRTLKHEILSTKSETNPNVQKTQNSKRFQTRFWRFGFSEFEIYLILGLFRISIFEFRILTKTSIKNGLKNVATTRI